MSTCSKKKHQKGAAILLALILMTVLATLASAAIAKNWAQQRGSSIIQKNMQQDALLVSAQFWGHSILIEDGLENRTDDLNEAWATPSSPIPLGAFLGLEDQSNAFNAMVMVRINDLTGKWNILNLRRAPPESQHHLLARKIAAYSGLHPERLIRLVANAPPETPAGWVGASSALRSPESPDACLRWLGLTNEEIVKTKELLTCLPSETALNINTVDPKFFKWLLDPLLADELIKEREKKPFSSTIDAAERINVPPEMFPFFMFESPSVGWDASSTWFAIHTQVTIDGVTWGTTQTVNRLGSLIQTLSTTNDL